MTINMSAYDILQSTDRLIYTWASRAYIMHQLHVLTYGRTHTIRPEYKLILVLSPLYIPTCTTEVGCLGLLLTSVCRSRLANVEACIFFSDTVRSLAPYQPSLIHSFHVTRPCTYVCVVLCQCVCHQINFLHIYTSVK